MKKYLLVSLTALCLLFGINGFAFAANTGTHITTVFGGNDDLFGVEEAINNTGFFSTNVDLIYAGKAESGSTEDGFSATGFGNSSGTWSDSNSTIYFYTVKAGGGGNSGGGYEIYWVDGGATSGVNWNWELTTINKGMSHVSGWTVDGTPPSAVPIPASLFLLGSGLIGVVGLGRRQKKSA